MSLIKQIYRTLRPIRDSIVDQSMAAALPTADPTSRKLIVLSLLERRHEEGLAPIVAHYHLLNKDLQRLIGDHIGQFDSVLRQTANNVDPQTRLNAVELIVSSLSFRLAYLLADQLHHGDARTIRAASAGLFKLARMIDIDSKTPDSIDAPFQPVARLRWVHTALTDAAACYHQHSRHDIIYAIIMLLPRTNDKLEHLISSLKSPIHNALRECLRRADHPAVLRGLLCLSHIDSLKPAITEGLRRRSLANHLPLLAKNAHLTLLPAIRGALRAVVNADHLAPDQKQIAEYTPSERRLLPRWLAVVRATRPTVLGALDQLIADEDPITRITSLRTLMTLDSANADDLIATLTYDSEPLIARSALRHLMLRKWVGLDKLMVRLISSAHQDVRALAERHLAPVGFNRLWSFWEHLDPPTRLAAGRGLIKIDPHFHKQLSDRLHSEHNATRFRAVMMVRALHQETFFENELLGLISDSDRKVASAAATALGRFRDSSRVAAALTSALDHPDDRVRSNAVESLESMDALAFARESLLKVASSRGNRSRATAIRALLKLPMGNALGALEQMLQDDSAQHRISALWVVEQMGLLDVAQTVASLARHDDEPEVKTRAVRIVRQLVADHAHKPVAAS